MKCHLIGPRPERLVFIKTFKTEIPHFEERLIVKPGITGWAQINGGYDLTPKEKLNLDLFYIKHLSFVLDIENFITFHSCCSFGKRLEVGNDENTIL